MTKYKLAFYPRDSKKNNAPCQTAISINEFLASENIFAAPEPSHSPNLLPFLFSKIFGTFENIEKTITDQLKAIPESEFEHSYEECEFPMKEF
ncbi:hypothetical protein Trydic_g17187 [Trypoxylus dichotomus]